MGLGLRERRRRHMVRRTHPLLVVGVVVASLAGCADRQAADLRGAAGGRLASFVRSTLSTSSYRVVIEVITDDSMREEFVVDRRRASVRVTSSDHVNSTPTASQLSVERDVYTEVPGKPGYFFVEHLPDTESAALLTDPSLSLLRSLEHANRVSRLSAERFRFELASTTGAAQKGEAVVRGSKLLEVATNAEELQKRYRFSYMEVPRIERPPNDRILEEPPTVTCQPTGLPPAGVPACAAK